MTTTDDKVELTLCLSAELRDMLLGTARQERRAPEDVLYDALVLYARHRTSGWKRYRALANRLAEAVPGSEGEALARADLEAALAAELGFEVPFAGGDPDIVRARLRRRRAGESSA